MCYSSIFLSLGSWIRAAHSIRCGPIRKTGMSLPPPDPKDLQRRINCPQCGKVMDTHPYGGPGNVIIDDCERCAVNWLDYGELQRIVRAPEHHYGDN